MQDIKRLRTTVLLVLLIVALTSLLGAVLLGNQEWDALLLNLGTEIAGAIVTYALFELVIEHRQRLRDEKEALDLKKKRLIAQLSSEVRNTAIAAAEELRQCGWLFDGSIRGADLGGADLHGIDLSRAYLNGTDLREANLIEVNLFAAQLHGANLSKANLSGANLRGANLSGSELFLADLSKADLEGAKLYAANLLGADLREADLHGARVTTGQLVQTKSLKDAIMPDGTKHD